VKIDGINYLVCRDFRRSFPPYSAMQRVNVSRETTFGYLTAVASPEHGYFGGYLILSILGRPLEFHCTAPIQPSRAQEILYGPTLQPYLLGEQICGALLANAKLSPVVILTDRAAVLQARSRSAVPIVFLTTRLDSTVAGTMPDHSSNGSHEAYELELAPGFEGERSRVVDALSQLAKHVELMEPFGRIREAIHEAQRIGSRGPNAHDQAA
jgi:hypothetical protein